MLHRNVDIQREISGAQPGKMPAIHPSAHRQRFSDVETPSNVRRTKITAHLWIALRK
jgi:hypothetical protein